MVLKNNIEKLRDIYESVLKYDVDLSKSVMASLDFNQCRHNLYIQEWKTQINRVRKEIENLSRDEIEDSTKTNLLALLDKLDRGKDLDKVMIDQLMNISKEIKVIQKENIVKIPISVPSEIYPEIEMDVNELNNCFSSGCYRSSVILCGRIIEVALHRKYFELTGNDLLEKSPGIGLGNLIARMKERNLEFDPGITQQIHLVNQVRIFSVHKKQQPFYPTKQQAYAMILYTMDILEKIFA